MNKLDMLVTLLSLYVAFNSMPFFQNLLVQSLMTRMRALRSQIGSVKPTIGWKRGTPRTNRKQPHLMPASPAFIPDFSESREMHDTRVEMLQLVCKSDHPSKKVLMSTYI